MQNSTPRLDPALIRLIQVHSGDPRAIKDSHKQFRSQAPLHTGEVSCSDCQSFEVSKSSRSLEYSMGSILYCTLLREVDGAGKV